VRAAPSGAALASPASCSAIHQFSRQSSVVSGTRPRAWRDRRATLFPSERSGRFPLPRDSAVCLPPQEGEARPWVRRGREGSWAQPQVSRSDRVGPGPSPRKGATWPGPLGVQGGVPKSGAVPTKQRTPLLVVSTVVGRSDGSWHGENAEPGSTRATEERQPFDPEPPRRRNPCLRIWLTVHGSPARSKQLSAVSCRRVLLVPLLWCVAGRALGDLPRSTDRNRMFELETVDVGIEISETRRLSLRGDQMARVALG